MTGEQSSSGKLLALGLAGALVLSAVVVLGPGFAWTVAAANQPSGDGSSWPQDQYDDARTGHTDATSGPKGPVESQWTATLTDASDLYHVPPVVANGTVFVGSDDGNVSAYNATTGAHLWTTRVTGFTKTDVTSLTLEDGVLYVSGIEYVFALDPETGATVWSSPFSFLSDGVESRGAGIVVSDGRLYVAAGSLSDGILYALNATTGTEEWRFNTDLIVWEGGVTLANDTLFVGDGGSSSFTGDGGVYAVNATSGTERWSKDYTGVRVRAAPTVGNGVVYVGKENGELVAYDESTGTEQWSTTVAGDVVNSPAVADGVVYVATKEPAEVHALDANTGNSAWGGPFTAAGDVSSPVVVDGVVYAGGGGEIYGLYPGNGTDRFTHAFGALEPGTPAVVDGTVYVHESDVSGKLHAIADETEPAFFDVTVTGTNSPVDEGATVDVDADVENTGDDTATQTVELLIDGAVNDSTSVTLDSGQTKTVTLQWNTGTGDAGDYTATVRSENDTDTVSVSVEAPTTTSTPTPTTTSTATPTTTATSTTSSAPVSDGGGPSAPVGTTTTTPTETPTPTTTTTTPTPQANVSGGEAVAFGGSDLDTPTPTPTPEAYVSGGEAVAYGLSDAQTLTPTPAESSPSSAATTTEAEAPGFGLVPAVVALLLAMALYRRR